MEAAIVALIIILPVLLLVASLFGLIGGSENHEDYQRARALAEQRNPEGFYRHAPVKSQSE